MRLDKLTIRSRFKNLNNFTIDFDQKSSATVLVGRNGTGKSNLLEALTLIFRDLDLGESPAFSFQLDYICRKKKVQIDADPTRTNKNYDISVDGNAISLAKFLTQPKREFLPNYVFGYYSGPSNRMESHFLKHQELFYRDLINGKEQPLRPLFYARPVHSQFVLLAFFVEDDVKVQQFLSNELWIEGLDYALFVMREPPWKSKEGDNRFWKARGVVSGFLDKLYKVALAPLRNEHSVPIGFRKSKSLEHLYLYLQNIDSIREVVGNYSSKQEFFKALESTYMSELISEVSIRVKAKKLDGSLTFRQMSEGEQQLLMVLGLLRFTREEESLFLLDEPDTHLNPAWSVKYLEFLNYIGGTQDNSHIIMATHDPLVISGLTRTQVQILQRNESTGEITASIPDKDPKGMGVAALLTSEMYGLRSQLDLATLSDLDKKRNLAAKENLSSKEEEELKELTNKLFEIDFTTATRDPLFSLFAKQMSSLEKEAGLQIPSLSPAQQKKQKDLATQILREIKLKEAK